MQSDFVLDTESRIFPLCSKVYILMVYTILCFMDKPWEKPFISLPHLRFAVFLVTFLHAIYYYSIEVKVKDCGYQVSEVHFVPLHQLITFCKSTNLSVSPKQLSESI